MNIPTLTKQQLFYSVIGILLIVILMFVVRDYQAQTYINANIEVCNNNLDWLADRCGCDLQTEIQEAQDEAYAKENFVISWPS